MRIRTELTKSHDRWWSPLARAGTWLTGEERVAIAAESRAARRCALCLARKQALSPLGVDGDHEAATDLPTPHVEIVHKLVTDPGRITRSWVDERFEEGVEDATYVEIAGLVSSVLVVDTFHAAVGLPLRDLPEPIAGSPNRYRPPGAVFEQGSQRGFVPIIPVDGLDADTADLYDTSRSFVPNVHRAFSLVPDATRTAGDLMQSHYFPYELVPRYTDADHGYAINKVQMELLASRVSILNDCFY